jgi:hypothetical protein
VAKKSHAIPNEENKTRSYLTNILVSSLL